MVSSMPAAAWRPSTGRQKVTIQDLGNAGEFVAAIATVVTLIYLALQLRSNTRVGRFDAHLKSRQLVAESHKILAEPDKARLWRIGLGDPDALSDDERISFNSILFLVVNAMDARFEYQRATFDPNAYEPQRSALDELASQPGFQRWWKIAAPFYNTNMNARVERSIRNASSDPSPFY